MKRYFDMTEEEIERKARLSEKEQYAVDMFIAAAKKLPRNICIDVASWKDDDVSLSVSKRITKGSAQQVAKLKKRSLIFA